MEQDNIRLDIQLLQLGNTVLYVLKMLRAKPFKIPAVSLGMRVVVPEIILCDYAAVHRRAIIRIRTGFAEIIVVVLRENAEPYFIER